MDYFIFENLSKKPRALTFVELLKVATGDHFQDSKFMISLKDPGLSLVSFYAPGPFIEMSSNKIYIVGVFKCPRKIHLNKQC